MSHTISPLKANNIGNHLGQRFNAYFFARTDVQEITTVVVLHEKIIASVRRRRNAKTHGAVRCAPGDDFLLHPVLFCFHKFANECGKNVRSREVKIVIWSVKIRWAYRILH